MEEKLYMVHDDTGNEPEPKKLTEEEKREIENEIKKLKRGNKQ